MARISKYEMFVGKVVNGIYVSDYRRLQKISKAGRKYYRYEVQVDNVLWISTTSWNKQTFVKRLDKIKQQQTKQTKYLPAVIIKKPITSQIISKYVRQLRTETDYNEFKKQFKILANICHPDKGGNEKVFDMLNKIYKIQGNIIKQAQPILTKKLDVNSVGYKETINAMVKAAFTAKGLDYLY